MSSGNTCTLRVMAWNIGFGSRKDSFLEDDVRAQTALEIVTELDADIVALQEMGNAAYSGGLRSFNLEKYLRGSDLRFISAGIATRMEN
jgi:endonuclease/exonuclease/phosphatase family metal-dependent hydrolase